MVGVLEEQAVVGEQAETALLGVELGEQTVDQRLIADESAIAGLIGVSSLERQRGKAVPRAEHRLVPASLTLGGVRPTTTHTASPFSCEHRKNGPTTAFG